MNIQATCSLSFSKADSITACYFEGAPANYPVCMLQVCICMHLFNFNLLSMKIWILPSHRVGFDIIQE